MKMKIESHLIAIREILNSSSYDISNLTTDLWNIWSKHKDINENFLKRLERIEEELSIKRSEVKVQAEDLCYEEVKALEFRNSTDIDGTRDIPSMLKEKWPPDWQKAFWGSSKAPSDRGAIKLELCIKDEHVDSKRWEGSTLRFLKGKDIVHVKNITIYYDSYEEAINSFNFEEIESFTITRVL